MDYKLDIINKFETLLCKELEELDNITDQEERNCKRDTLYKIYKYLSNFDELEPVLKKFFDEKAEKEKYER